MVLDNEVCTVGGCTIHTGWIKKTPIVERNDQIREDWATGHWSVDELSCFWDLKPKLVHKIVSIRRADSSRADL